MKKYKEKLYIKVLDIAYSTKLEIVTTNIKEAPKILFQLFTSQMKL